MILNLKIVDLIFFLDNKYNLAAIIKINKKLFNFIFIVNTYIITFIFGEKKLYI